MVASGCASTATYAYTVGLTLPQAGFAILVQPPFLGNNGSAMKTSPGWAEITDSDFQHMEPISDAAAAHNAQYSVVTPVQVPSHGATPQPPPILSCCAGADMPLATQLVPAEDAANQVLRASEAYMLKVGRAAACVIITHNMLLLCSLIPKYRS